MKKITSMNWVGDLPLSKWALFYSRILRPLSEKEGLAIEVSLSSIPPHGLTEGEFQIFHRALQELALEKALEFKEGEVQDRWEAVPEGPPVAVTPSPSGTPPDVAGQNAPGDSGRDGHWGPTQEEIDLLPEKEVTLWVNWTHLARAVNKAGRLLRLGDELTSASRFQEEISKSSHYDPEGILPSDYCYNVIDKALCSFRFPLLEEVEPGMFRYLGPNYPYSGTVRWHPSGSKRPLTVGRWTEGKCYLRYDPRR